MATRAPRQRKGSRRGGAVKDGQGQPALSLPRLIQKDMLRLYRLFQDGERTAIFDAILMSCFYGVTIPEWVHLELRMALERYRSYQVKDLDEAFGIKEKRDSRRKAKHHKTPNGLPRAYALYLEIETERAAGASVDCPLFEEVGKRFSLSGATAQQWYYEVRAAISPKN